MDLYETYALIGQSPCLTKAFENKRKADNFISRVIEDLILFWGLKVKRWFFLCYISGVCCYEFRDYRWNSCRRVAHKGSQTLLLIEFRFVYRLNFVDWGKTFPTLFHKWENLGFTLWVFREILWSFMEVPRVVPIIHVGFH